MATWGSRGLRGEQLEELINIANEKYREAGLALVQKIPTPITPVEIDDNRHITLAYFDRRSTVDYIGAVQSYPVCFDAKECAAKTFAMSNVHEHQYDFMRDFEAQGGISFLIIYFTKTDEVYYMRFKELERYYKRAHEGGSKHVDLDELDPRYFLMSEGALKVHYLDGVKKDIAEADRN